MFKGLIIAVIVILLGITLFTSSASASEMPVTFDQTGVPPGMSWSISVESTPPGGPVVEATVTGNSATVILPAGSYAYSIDAGGGVFSAQGNFSVHGITIVNVQAVQRPDTVVFISTGPSSIAMSSAKLQVYGNISAISLTPGNYSFDIQASQGHNISYIGETSIVYAQHNTRESLLPTQTEFQGHSASYNLVLYINNISYVVFVISNASSNVFNFLESHTVYFIHHPSSSILSIFTDVKSYIEDPASIPGYLESHTSYDIIGILVLIILVMLMRRKRSTKKAREEQQPTLSNDIFFGQQEPAPRQEPEVQRQRTPPPDSDHDEPEQPGDGEDERKETDEFNQFLREGF